MSARTNFARLSALGIILRNRLYYAQSSDSLKRTRLPNTGNPRSCASLDFTASLTHQGNDSTATDSETTASIDFFSFSPPSLTEQRGKTSLRMCIRHGLQTSRRAAAAAAGMGGAELCLKMLARRKSQMVRIPQRHRV